MVKDDITPGVLGMARILVIDDEKPIREMLTDILEEEGHEVTCAKDGVEGIAQYREKLHDLIITDVFMPEKSGLETILDLKDEFPQIKIIAMTGWDTKSDIDVLAMAEEWGADVVLSKPFKAGEVTNKIRVLLG